MNPLESLAAFLGVEASPEAVMPALDELIANFPNLSEEERTAMRDAMGVASDEELLAALQSYRAEMDAQPDAEDGMGRDYNALKSFGAALAARPAKSANGASVPVLTQHDGLPGKKARHNGGAPAQIGKAAKPSLQGMVRDIKAGKSQSYQTGPQGGYIVRHEVASEILAALRSKLPLFDMGVQEYPLEGMQSLTIPKVTSETSASWVGEGDENTDSDETYGVVTLQPKPLVASVIAPRQMFTNAVVNYEQHLRDGLEYQIRRAIMYAALFGTGGGAQPVGLTNISAVTSTSLGTNGATPTINDMHSMIGRVEDANVEIDDTAAWLMSPRSERTFTGMMDQEGRPILRGSWADGAAPTLLDYPRYTSTVITNNNTVGSSSDCSFNFFGVWRFMAIGMSDTIEIQVLDQTRAKRLQNEILAYTYADIAVLYPEAFEVLTGVRA